MIARAPAPPHPGRAAVALLWTSAAAAGLLLPAHRLPDGWEAGDTLAHVVIFGVATALWTWALPRRGWAVVAVIAALAVGSEVGQGVLVPGRSAQWGDLGANLVGIALGWLLARGLVRGGGRR